MDLMNIQNSPKVNFSTVVTICKAFLKDAKLS